VKRLIAPVICLAILVTACSSKSGSGGSVTGSTGSSALTVFAASSLKGAFTQIAADFNAANPGDTVTFNFGASNDLAAQIESEGTADVFAAASGKYMDEVQQKVGVDGRTDFAQNRLIIITPPENPAAITSIADLAKPGVQLVLAAAGVPVGDYAREALTSAGIADAALANVVSNEEDDASVVAKITSGEADAAIVYASDVTDQVAPQVKAIQIPDDVNVLATYPIAVVNGTTDAAAAQAFVAYVAGAVGQATLKTFGFLPPPVS
jgi:molybdate transport system substrate-binding protein